jgi:hypothetical protein
MFHKELVHSKTVLLIQTVSDYEIAYWVGNKYYIETDSRKYDHNIVTIKVLYECECVVVWDSTRTQT